MFYRSLIWLAFAVLASAAYAGDPLPWRDDLLLKDRLRVERVLNAPESFSKAEAFEAMSAGATTSTAIVGPNAFSNPLANLPFDAELDFRLGNSLFKKIWVSSPSSTQASDGLGPLFNARSCQRCHLKDGRGHPPNGPDDLATSMLLQISIEPQTPEHRSALETGKKLTIPHPVYGNQLQDFAVPGLPAEGRMVISYEYHRLKLNGGEEAVLEKPIYSIRNPGFGAFPADLMISPRVAPQMIGLGLLEAIHRGDILAMADPDDLDGDGISGKAHLLPGPDRSTSRLGRFGHKATSTSIREQSAGAFFNDIGISTPDLMDPFGDCTALQTACRALPTGVQRRLGESEAPRPILELVTFYSKNLAVPMRRDSDDPGVLMGKKLFYEIGCVDCHRAKYVTSRNAEQSEHQFQLIWPYTDMLLHDMGDGLADFRPVGIATGREWRTPPLWGIGLTQTVNGHTRFLHDGRARNLLEAILWHGGEAEQHRDAVVGLMPQERRSLIRFLESL